MQREHADGQRTKNSTHVNTRLPNDLLDWIDEQAAEQGVPRTTQVVRLLELGREVLEEKPDAVHLP